MDLFIYSRRYRVAICRECKYAVLSDHLEAHLTGPKHRNQNISKAERRAIQQEISAWLGIRHIEADLERFCLTETTAEPMAHLIKYTDGKRCEMVEESETYVVIYAMIDRGCRSIAGDSTVELTTGSEA